MHLTHRSAFLSIARCATAALLLAVGILPTLIPSMARGAAVRMAVMGDSISAPSSTNWIGQLGTSFPGAISCG